MGGGKGREPLAAMLCRYNLHMDLMLSASNKRDTRVITACRAQTPQKAQLKSVAELDRFQSVMTEQVFSVICGSRRPRQIININMIVQSDIWSQSPEQILGKTSSAFEQALA